MLTRPIRHGDHMYLYIYEYSNRETRPIQFAVRNDITIPAPFTGESIVYYYLEVIPLAHLVDESRASTLSLWALFLRCTSKFEADVSGPGVYNFPGQSRHRILGRK